MRPKDRRVQISDHHRFIERIAEVLDGTPDAAQLIQAVQMIFPCEAGFAVLNRRAAAPVYLADSYPDAASKAAVQLYVRATYEINPVFNAIESGLREGVVRMADLAPDNWVSAGVDVVADASEEIGYRTPGWPAGMQEVSVLIDLPDDVVGEISLARNAVAGGVPEADLAPLKLFLPLIRVAFNRIAADHADTLAPDPAAPLPLGSFGREVLSSREAEILQMILKGYSSLSISLHLGIAMPTVKSHRRNAYAKLGNSTQQQLFRLYLDWRGV